MYAKQPMLASLFIDTLDDLERSLDGLGPEDAEKQLPNAKSISQIVAHIAHWVDSWVNASMGSLDRNHYLACVWHPNWQKMAPRWQEVRAASSEVFDRARGVLSNMGEQELAQASLYEGSQAGIRGKHITGNYRLGRIVAHTYYHIADITTIRARLGHKVEDFPGQLSALLQSTQGRLVDTALPDRS